MSKSLGNFFTIREIFDKSPVSDAEAITGECLRYYLLSTHYRSDLNFSEQSLPEAKAAMDTIYGLIQRLEESDSQESHQGDEDWEKVSKEFVRKFQESMDDDFNTPKALGAFHELRGEVNKLLMKGLSKETKSNVIETFKKYGKPLGLFQIPAWFTFSVEQNMPVESPGYKQEEKQENCWIEELIRLRNEARAKKDFATADKIRQELDEKKITLEDRPDGTTRWKR
jgi:cysteinyl-tRNA synthetase